MATWREVRDYIYANYQVSGDNDGLLTLLFDTGDGRSQIVFVGAIAEGTALGAVRFFSPFATKSQISMAQFIGVAEDSTFGLAVVGEMYGVVHNAFLENLDSTEIDIPMAAVTQSADDLERRLAIGDGF